TEASMLTCEKVAYVPEWDDAITFGSLGDGSSSSAAMEKTRSTAAGATQWISHLLFIPPSCSGMFTIQGIWRLGSLSVHLESVRTIQVVILLGQQSALVGQILVWQLLLPLFLRRVW